MGEFEVNLVGYGYSFISFTVHCDSFEANNSFIHFIKDKDVICSVRISDICTLVELIGGKKKEVCLYKL